MIENLRYAHFAFAQAGAGIIPEHEAIAENGLKYGDSISFYVREGLDWRADVYPAIRQLTAELPNQFDRYLIMPRGTQLIFAETQDLVHATMSATGLSEKIASF